jgi:hypothetical protein
MNSRLLKKTQGPSKNGIKANERNRKANIKVNKDEMIVNEERMEGSQHKLKTEIRAGKEKKEATITGI